MYTIAVICPSEGQMFELVRYIVAGLIAGKGEQQSRNATNDKFSACILVR